MAKAMHIGVNGIARKTKKIYIGVDNVARKVKAAYIGVNGVAHKFYSGSPVTYSFALQGFPLDPASTNTTVSPQAVISSWSAGFKDNGDILLSIYTKNGIPLMDAAPSARVKLTFDDPAAAAGKFIKFTFNNKFNCDKSYNYLYFEYTQNGANKRQGFTATWSDGAWSSFTVPDGTTDLSFVMVLGEGNDDGYDDYGNITITSITMAGEEILK